MAVAIVARKSTRDDAQVSVSRQEKMGREWAAREHSGEPVLVFKDNATSGVDMEREGWTDFTEAVRRGLVDAVWAYDQSRVTRGGTEPWDAVCVMLSTAGIPTLFTASGPVGVAEGQRLGGRITAVVDQEYRERARISTVEGLQTIAEEGRPSGATGYGYTRSVGPDLRPALVPDPVEAAVVRRIVQEVAEGASLGLVATRLNRDGIPTPRGSSVWRRETVKAIATAPRIVGDRVHRGKVVAKARWEPIVNRELWDRAQRSIGTPRKRSGERRRYLLTGGLAVCDACGTALISGNQYNRGVQPAYICPHPSRHDGGCGKLSVLADRLEAHVVQVVEGWLAALDFAEAVEALYAGDQAEATPLRRELAEIEAQLIALAENNARDLLDFEYQAARKRLLTDRGRVLSELAELPPVVEVDPVEIVAAWREGGNETRREIVRVLADLPIRVRRGPRQPVADRVVIEPRW